MAQPIAQGIADALNIDTDIPNFHKLSQNIGIWWEEFKLWWQLNVFEPVGKFWGELVASIIIKFNEVILSFKKFGEDIGIKWNEFWSWLTGIATSIYNWGRDRLADLINFGADLGKNVTEFFTVTIPEKWENFKKWLGKIPSYLKSIGDNLVKGLWDGINGATGWLKKKIKEWVDGIIDSIQSFFGIASPSKVMADEVGSYMAQGIGVGFNKTLPSVIQAMQEKLGLVTDSLQTELSFGDIPQIEGNKIISENSYVTKNYTNTIETIRQPQAVELVLDGTKLARALIQPLDNEYNRLGVKI